MTQDVESLLAQLRETLKEELRAEVRAELIAELGGAKPAPAKSEAAPKAKPGPKPKANQGGRKTLASVLQVKPGQRRSEEELKTAARTLADILRQLPNSRVDQIAKRVGVPVKDLQRPVQLLLEGKWITSKGKLRGTTYSTTPKTDKALRGGLGGLKL